MHHYVNDLQLRQFNELLRTNQELGRIVTALATAVSFHRLVARSEDPYKVLEEGFLTKLTREVAFQLRQQAAHLLQARDLWDHPFQLPESGSLIDAYSRFQLGLLTSGDPTVAKVNELQQCLTQELLKVHQAPDLILNLEQAIQGCRPVLRGLPTFMKVQQQIVGRQLYQVPEDRAAVGLGVSPEVCRQLATLSPYPVPPPPLNQLARNRRENRRGPQSASQSQSQVQGDQAARVLSPSTLDYKVQ